MFWKLRQKREAYGISPAKNLFTAIVVLFSVRHMQLRLYVAHFKRGGGGLEDFDVDLPLPK